MATESASDQKTGWASLFDLDDAERLTDRAWRAGAWRRHAASVGQPGAV